MAEASGGENTSSPSATTSTDSSDQAASGDSLKEKPTCILCLGMAGSGKTTFVQVYVKRFPRLSKSDRTFRLR